MNDFLSEASSLLRGGKSSTDDDHNKPLIKAFHCWQIQWDSGGLSSLGKRTRAVFNPRTPIRYYDRRLITCEIHRIPPVKRGGLESEKCIVRVLVPISQSESTSRGKDDDSSSSDASSSSDDSSTINDEDEDESDTTALSKRQKRAYYHFDSIGPIGGLMAGRVNGFGISEEDGGGSSDVPLPSEWKTRKQLSLNKMNVVSQIGRKVLLSVGLGHSIKSIKFASETEASGFLQLIAHLKAGQEKRAGRRRMAAINSLKIEDHNATCHFLVEVVSCWGLPAVDRNGASDPYVRVSFEGREIHRTDCIYNTTEPIWTVKTGSLFIFSTTLSKLFDAREGMAFDVKDYDNLGSNEALGGARLLPRAIFDADGERLVLPLVPIVGQPFAEGGCNGFIAIRCRRATNDDLTFMERLKTGGISSVGSSSPLALKSAGGKHMFKTLVTSNTKKDIDHNPRSPSNAIVTKQRVRPHPDPARPEETKWMTPAQIQEESMKRSTNWIDAGSGSHAKIYLEVIGCDELPNLDGAAGALSGKVKTDAFVCIVFEDVVLKTDVIGNTLSPRWMPWCKRAFCLRQLHSSSQIFLGIFDYNSAGENDRAGRVVIDLSTYSPNTEYLLHFSIHNKEALAKRKPRGSISVRLLLEYEDGCGMATSALTWTPGHAYFVNTQKKKDFIDVRYTATGKYGAERYGMKQINKYLDEIYTCRRALFYLHELAVHTILWRGHAHLNIHVPRFCPCKDIEELGGKGCTRKVTILLPIRSLVVFIAAVHLVENPDDIPSFIFGAIAFVMLSTLHFRRKCPNHLGKPQPFYFYLGLLLLGRDFGPKQDVKPFDNAEEYKEYKKNIEDRATKFEEEAETARQEDMQKQEAEAKEWEEIGLANQIDISTKTGGSGSGFSINPLTALYVQIQVFLEVAVKIFRFTRNILVWEEAFLAFWLTLSSLALSVVCIFIPWGQVIEWTMRFLVWTFLGPWMKLVDLFWKSHVKHWWHSFQRYQEQQQKLLLDAAKMEAQITKESVEKYKDMKVAIFGKYICRVPVYKVERYRDVPLPASEAHKYSAAKLKKEISTNGTTLRVHGQRLSGEMILTIEDPVIESTTSATGASAINRMLPSLAKHRKPSKETDPLLS